MPFTISHCAAVLPLKKFRLNLMALIIGAMMPDFFTFFPFFASKQASHELAGIFLVNLPAGIITALCFVYVFKRPLIALLPYKIEQRLLINSAKTPGRKEALKTDNPVKILFSLLQFSLIFILSLIVGSFTHLLWDSFTHPYTWLHQRFPLLNRHLFTFASIRFEGFVLLQLASSVAGLWILGIQLRKWLKQPLRGEPANPAHKIRKIITWTILVGVPVIASIVWTIQAYLNGMVHWIRNFALFLIYDGGQTFLLFLILYMLGWNTADLIRKLRGCLI